MKHESEETEETMREAVLIRSVLFGPSPVRPLRSWADHRKPQTRNGVAIRTRRGEADMRHDAHAVIVGLCLVVALVVVLTELLF